MKGSSSASAVRGRFGCFGSFGRGPGPATLTKLRSKSRSLGLSLVDEVLDWIDEGLFQLSFLALRVCLISMMSFSSSSFDSDSSVSSGPGGSFGASGADLPGSEVVEREVAASATLFSPLDPSVSESSTSSSEFESETSV